MGAGFVQRWLSWLVFPPPREMTHGDIQTVTRQFVDAARLMADAGFSGIELHGAHGYLIGMFMHLAQRVWRVDADPCKTSFLTLRYPHYLQPQQKKDAY
jgi:hypothetical protein